LAIRHPQKRAPPQAGNLRLLDVVGGPRTFSRKRRRARVHAAGIVSDHAAEAARFKASRIAPRPDTGKALVGDDLEDAV
jgi:hypothetical protein